MTVTAVMYCFWAATVGLAATTIVRALLTEHPLSGVGPVERSSFITRHRRPHI